MNKTEKETQIVIGDGVNTTKMEANISWYESYICDSSNHMYTSEDGKIYNFTITYNIPDVTLEQAKQLTDLMEKKIKSKTIRLCKTSFMGTGTGMRTVFVDEYYFTEINQYNEIVEYFTN